MTSDGESADRRRHVARRSCVLVLSVSVVLAACGDSDEEAGDRTTTTDTSTTTTPEQSEPASQDGASGESDPSVAGGTVFDVVVAGGEVSSGGGRRSVELGDTVTVRVTSDVADSIHLHGYDVEVELPAGQAAELRFEATIPGVFEVELENSGLPLLELEIS